MRTVSHDICSIPDSQSSRGSTIRAFLLVFLHFQLSSQTQPKRRGENENREKFNFSEPSKRCTSLSILEMGKHSKCVCASSRGRGILILSLPVCPSLAKMILVPFSYQLFQVCILSLCLWFSETKPLVSLSWLVVIILLKTTSILFKILSPNIPLGQACQIPEFTVG